MLRKFGSKMIDLLMRNDCAAGSRDCTTGTESASNVFWRIHGRLRQGRGIGEQGVSLAAGNCRSCVAEVKAARGGQAAMAVSSPLWLHTHALMAGLAADPRCRQCSTTRSLCEEVR